MIPTEYKKLFEELYFAPTEDAVDAVIQSHPDIFKDIVSTLFGFANFIAKKPTLL